MVESNIRGLAQAAHAFRYKGVRATRGKTVRAEPVFGMYEQKKIKHVGTHVKLEYQMVNWNPEGDSPDRVDAMVWGVTELLIKTTPSVTRGHTVKNRPKTNRKR